MISVYCPKTYQPEREYICHVLLKEFLGLEFHIEYRDADDWIICDEQGNNSLVLPDLLFKTPKKQWLTTNSLPRQPLAQWDAEQSGFKFNLIDKKIPVIFGNLDFFSSQRRSSYSKKYQKTVTLPIDIFGSAFFMLSRYEEVVKPDRDAHDRFPAWASLAYQEGFLSRPIVIEYLEILWAYMKSLWQGLERKQRTYQMLVTCDVDHPYQDGLRNPIRQIKTIGGDLIYRKNPLLATKSTLNYLASRFGNYSLDPYLTAIYWIMDINEKAGNRVTFYFKADQTDPQFDSSYSLDEPIIRKLLRDIHNRGHEIGLHPSYRTYRDGKQLCLEADNLRRVLEEEKICQDTLGSRQHYLRWDSATTPLLLEKAGIDCDTTLSYADHVGFRCGVCFEYPMYDLVNLRPLTVMERPLIIMEGSLFGPDYMNIKLSTNTLETIYPYKDWCIKFSGSFTLLWHNSSFLTIHERKIYRETIQGIAKCN